MSKNSAYVGLDVHRNSISIAAAQAGSNAQPELHARMPWDMADLLRKLALFGAPSTVHVC